MTSGAVESFLDCPFFMYSIWRYSQKYNSQRFWIFTCDRSEYREQTTWNYAPSLGMSGTDHIGLYATARNVRHRPHEFTREHSDRSEETKWIYTPSLGMSGREYMDLYAITRNVRKTHHRFTRDCEGCPARYFKNQIFHEPCPLRCHQVLKCCAGCPGDYHHI